MSCTEEPLRGLRIRFKGFLTGLEFVAGFGAYVWSSLVVLSRLEALEVVAAFFLVFFGVLTAVAALGEVGLDLGKTTDWDLPLAMLLAPGRPFIPAPAEADLDTLEAEIMALRPLGLIGGCCWIEFFLGILFTGL